MLGLDAQAFQAFALFFCMFMASGMGAPIPEEIAIVAAGIWTAHHPEYGLARWLCLPVCIFAVVLADSILYTVGRFYGERLFSHRYMLRWVPREKQLRIRDNFSMYGVNILLFGRLVPGVRLPLFLTAGLLRLSVPKFILADGLGAVLGNGLFFLLAFWFGDQFKTLVDTARNSLEKTGPILIMASLAGVAGYLLYRFWRKPVAEGNPEELPLIGHQVATHIPHKELPLAQEKENAPAVQPGGLEVPSVRSPLR